MGRLPVMYRGAAAKVRIPSPTCPIRRNKSYLSRSSNGPFSTIAAFSRKRTIPRTCVGHSPLTNPKDTGYA